MKSKSSFWLTLHQLSLDLQQEGGTPDERAHGICEVLGSLSPPTKGVYLANLDLAIESLKEIAAKCKGD